MRRTKSEGLSNAAQTALASVSSGYSNPADPPGTIRFAPDDGSDSPFGNANTWPAVPIQNALYQEWRFRDNAEISTDVITIYKEKGDGTTDPDATVIALQDRVGGGITFATGVPTNGPGDSYRIYVIEGKQETIQVREGKGIWVEIEVKISGSHPSSSDITIMGGLSERQSNPDRDSIFFKIDRPVSQDEFSITAQSNANVSLDSLTGERETLSVNEWVTVNIKIEPYTAVWPSSEGDSTGGPTHIITVYLDGEPVYTDLAITESKYNSITSAQREVLNDIKTVQLSEEELTFFVAGVSSYNEDFDDQGTCAVSVGKVVVLQDE